MERFEKALVLGFKVAWVNRGACVRPWCGHPWLLSPACKNRFDRSHVCIHLLGSLCSLKCWWLLCTLCFLCPHLQNSNNNEVNQCLSDVSQDQAFCDVTMPKWNINIIFQLHRGFIPRLSVARWNKAENRTMSLAHCRSVTKKDACHLPQNQWTRLGLWIWCNCHQMEAAHFCTTQSKMSGKDLCSLTDDDHN